MKKNAATAMITAREIREATQGTTPESSFEEILEAIKKSPRAIMLIRRAHKLNHVGLKPLIKPTIEAEMEGKRNTKNLSAAQKETEQLTAYWAAALRILGELPPISDPSELISPHLGFSAGALSLGKRIKAMGVITLREEDLIDPKDISSLEGTTTRSRTQVLDVIEIESVARKSHIEMTEYDSQTGESQTSADDQGILHPGVQATLDEMGKRIGIQIPTRGSSKELKRYWENLIQNSSTYEKQGEVIALALAIRQKIAQAETNYTQYYDLGIAGKLNALAREEKTRSAPLKLLEKGQRPDEVYDHIAKVLKGTALDPEVQLGERTMRLSINPTLMVRAEQMLKRQRGGAPTFQEISDAAIILQQKELDEMKATPEEYQIVQNLRRDKALERAKRQREQQNRWSRLSELLGIGNKRTPEENVETEKLLKTCGSEAQKKLYLRQSAQQGNHAQGNQPQSHQTNFNRQVIKARIRQG